jgi:hypothetical protein
VNVCCGADNASHLARNRQHAASLNEHKYVRCVHCSHIQNMSAISLHTLLQSTRPAICPLLCHMFIYFLLIYTGNYIFIVQCTTPKLLVLEHQTYLKNKPLCKCALYLSYCQPSVADCVKVVVCFLPIVVLRWEFCSFPFSLYNINLIIFVFQSIESVSLEISIQ